MFLGNGRKGELAVSEMRGAAAAAVGCGYAHVLLCLSLSQSVFVQYAYVMTTEGRNRKNPLQSWRLYPFRILLSANLIDSIP